MAVIHVELRPGWQADAACRGMDPELFFDTQGSQGYDEARVVCAGCRVQFECLEFALASDPPEKFGIWGGLSEMQRRKVRRARRRATL